MANDEEIRPEDVKVKLKPMLGMAPTTYVPIIWGALILLILFLVLVAPGLKYNGTLLTVVSTPAKAAVYVDGVRQGATPGTFFVPRGERTVEVRRPGFTTFSETVRIRGRLIGSWLAPRRDTLAAELRDASDDALIAEAIPELSRWALAGEASGQYQFPPIARDLAEDLRAASSDQASSQAAWRTVLDRVAPRIESEGVLNDVAAATLSMGGSTRVAVPSGIAFAAQELARLAASAPEMATQMSSTLAPERRDLVASSSWASSGTAWAAALASAAPTGTTGATTSYPLGLRFLSFTGGTATLGGDDRATRGGDIAYRADVSPFALGVTEVPASAYLAFIDANPSWGPANTAKLVSDGLVNESYLDSIDAMRAETTLPVTGVSAYAAEAFAAWYDSLLPASLDARLPTESEWAYAEHIAGANDGVFKTDGRTSPVAVTNAGASGGLVGMIGNVWEWTATGFATYAPAYTFSRPDPDFQRVLRGGGWANDSLSFRPADRGALDPAMCSPFVGFRLLIATAR